MINESLILVRFTFATNSHFIDIIADKFLTRYYIGLKYIVTDVRRAQILVQKSLLVTVQRIPLIPYHTVRMTLYFNLLYNATWAGSKMDVLS